MEGVFSVLDAQLIAAVFTGLSGLLLAYLNSRTEVRKSARVELDDKLEECEEERDALREKWQEEHDKRIRLEALEAARAAAKEEHDHE